MGTTGIPRVPWDSSGCHANGNVNVNKGMGMGMIFRRIFSSRKPTARAMCQQLSEYVCGLYR